MKVLVSKSCPTLWDHMDYSLPGSSVNGISQAIVLEWIAISFSRGSSQPRDFSDVYTLVLGFPGGSGVKNSPTNAGDEGLIPGSSRSLGEGNGNPL